MTPSRLAKPSRPCTSTMGYFGCVYVSAPAGAMEPRQKSTQKRRRSNDRTILPSKQVNGEAESWIVWPTRDSPRVGEFTVRPRRDEIKRSFDFHKSADFRPRRTDDRQSRIADAFVDAKGILPAIRTP